MAPMTGTRPGRSDRPAAARIRAGSVRPASKQPAPRRASPGWRRR